MVREVLRAWWHSLNGLTVIAFIMRAVNIVKEVYSMGSASLRSWQFQSHSYIWKRQLVIWCKCSLLQFRCQLALTLCVFMSNPGKRVASWRMHYPWFWTSHVDGLHCYTQYQFIALTLWDAWGLYSDLMTIWTLLIMLSNVYGNCRERLWSLLTGHGRGSFELRHINR